MITAARPRLPAPCAVDNRRPRPTRLTRPRASLADLSAGLTACAALLPLSIAADGLLDRLDARVDALTNTNADGIACYTSFPSHQSRDRAAPVVVVVHQLFGLQQREVELCDKLAERGFVAVAVDTFHRKTTNWIPRALWLVYGKAFGPDPGYGVEEVHKAVKWMRGQEWGRTAPLAVMGFCYGGGCVMRMAARHPDDMQAAVVFYGKPVEYETVRNIKCPLLGIYGTRDSQFPKEMLDELEEALERCQMPFKISRYEGQPHAFVKDAASIQQQGAPRQAWEESISFLQEHLQAALDERDS